MPTMPAVRLYTGEGRLALEEVPIPDPGPTEVRVAVSRAGICLTDVHFIRGEPAAGMPEVVTLGHEVSRTVEAVGSAVDGIAEGTPVAINPVAHMGNATRVVGVHHDGGWAPFAVVPASAVVPVSPALPPEIAAIIPDAVSTPWAALSSTGAVRATETVAIWGVGGLGYHAVKLARILGAVPVVAVDPLPAARERALAGGADAAFSPDDGEALAGYVSAATDGRGLDAAFDFFGASDIHQQAFDLLAERGRLVLTGIPDEPFRLASTPVLIRRSRQVLGHYGSERRHIEEAARLVTLGRLQLPDSVTAQFPLDRYAEALDVLTSKRGNPIRVVLQP